VRLDSAGAAQLLEVNPLAGLNPVHSDLPIIAALTGMEYGALIAEILRCTRARLAVEAKRAAAA
jgi:D-alanine-D-alanine ligase